MSSLLDKPIKLTNRLSVNRPAWIPDHITENWDQSPYAYQTEEELMPAGGPHGRILTYILSLITYFTESKRLMFLLDTFMLYRDENGIKRRVAPDLLLMPFLNEAPSAYDLDIEPPPLMVVEVTSPDSHVSDLENKNLFYMRLGVPTYLVIDAVKPNSELREQIGLYLWRLIDGQMQQMQADSTGYLIVPELALGVRAEGQKLTFKDLETGELLKEPGQLVQLAEQQQQDLEEERRAREGERLAKEEERQARLQAEEKMAQLEAELERLRREQEK